MLRKSHFYSFSVYCYRCIPVVREGGKPHLAGSSFCPALPAEKQEDCVRYEMMPSCKQLQYDPWHHTEQAERAPV